MDSNDPVAKAAVHAIRTGDTTSLASLLSQHPGLVSEQIHQTRTPLHVVTDWPGYFPGAPATVRLLIEAGADPNVDSGGKRPETALHWAASSDDADVADALISGGADLETPGGSIGTPLDNAVGYGCWNVARLLVQRGARVDKLGTPPPSGLWPASRNSWPPPRPRQRRHQRGVLASLPRRSAPDGRAPAGQRRRPQRNTRVQRSGPAEAAAELGLRREPRHLAGRPTARAIAGRLGASPSCRAAGLEERSAACH